MSISFGSINTGLPKDIVQQIIAAEKIPLNSMEERKANFEEKGKLVDELINLFQDLHKLLADNDKVDSLRVLKALYNDELIDVTIDEDRAEPGEYQFSVEKLAKKSSVMTSGFEDPDDSYVGVGFIQYKLPDGEVKDIYIDSDNASLRGVANLINKDKDIGMRASIVNDGSGSDAPWRLLLSLTSTGDDNLADFPYFYFVDGEDDFYLDLEREANDAAITLDGFPLELPANTTSSTIPGLTIDLKKADPGNEFTIKIIEDKEAMSEKFTDLVEKMNAVLKFIKAQNSMDAKTNTRKTLGGDITLQTVESKIRTLIFTPIETRKGYQRFGDLGIIFQRDGLLGIDKKIFEAAVAKDYINVSDILVGHFNEDGVRTKGFINNLEEVVSSVIQAPDGILRNRRSGINSRIRQIENQITNRERIIDKKEQVLKDKFARLESTVSKLKNQGSGLAALAGGQGGAQMPDLAGG